MRKRGLPEILILRRLERICLDLGLSSVVDLQLGKVLRHNLAFVVVGQLPQLPSLHEPRNLLDLVPQSLLLEFSCGHLSLWLLLPVEQLPPHVRLVHELLSHHGH